MLYQKTSERCTKNQNNHNPQFYVAARKKNYIKWKKKLNPLNAELNPICHLLALLGAHHIFHVSGLRVKINKAIITQTDKGNTVIILKEKEYYN